MRPGMPRQERTFLHWTQPEAAGGKPAAVWCRAALAHVLLGGIPPLPAATAQLLLLLASPQARIAVAARNMF